MSASSPLPSSFSSRRPPPPCAYPLRNKSSHPARLGVSRMLRRAARLRRREQGARPRKQLALSWTADRGKGKAQRVPDDTGARATTTRGWRGTITATATAGRSDL